MQDRNNFNGIGFIIFIIFYCLFFSFILCLTIKAEKNKQYRKEIDQKIEQIWKDRKE